MTVTEEAKALIAQRDEIDAKIEENRQVLEVNKCTMDSPLIDAEGFPIATIDVYSVRHARHNIICLQNDRKALDAQIEEAIQKVHEEGKIEVTTRHFGRIVVQEGSSMDVEEGGEKPVHRTSNTPFAKVSTVTSGSPADLGGFQTDDLIIQYGNLHHDNFSNLAQFADATAKNEGKTLRVTVIRKDRPVRLQITPQKWEGKGLLGCGVVAEKPNPM